MDLLNQTGAVAYLHPVNLLEPKLRAVVVVKKTYALASDGTLAPASDPLPLVADQLVTDFGVFHGEIFFRKRGSDVCVLGTARVEKPVTQAHVRIEIGNWMRELTVWGDRVWRKERAGKVVPSSPLPFREMPISYSRAFGGIAEINGDDVPWTDNPMGRGYYETPEQAIGKPLHNIEAANEPEPSWDTRVPVAGWGPYPMYWGLRASRAVKYDKDSGEILDISPELFNHAHPDLIVPHLEPSSSVCITGMSPAPIRFSVPSERPSVYVQVGTEISDAQGELDGLFVWTDAARVVVTWRARFSYAVRPEEIRRAALSFVE